MKKIIFILAVSIITVFYSCESKRPDSTGEFNYSLKISSIQILADVEIKEGESVIDSGVTDESGTITFTGIKALRDITVKVCGGTVKLVTSEAPTAWTGCMESVIKPTDVDEIAVTVDILSTFISKYDSETSTEEWQNYLDMTTLPSPALQSSLTDASKRYLWYQGIAKVAENVSKANSVTPETMYSTENLLNLLLADLTDDAVINGSSKAKFGSLAIESTVSKSVLADAIATVDKAFSAKDLKNWTDKIRYSDAIFLGGSGEGVDSEKPVIEIEAPEDGEVIYGTVEIKASATDNIKITSLNCTIAGEEMPELEDSDDEDDKFISVFDSTLIPDGKIKINCIASDGTSLTEKEINVTVSNSNETTLKAFITNPLTRWDSVTVYGIDGVKVATLSFDEEEEPAAFLAPGSYRFVFKGGYYKPVYLDDEELKFDSTIETRGEIKAGEKTVITATPLTTLREHLYRALKEKSDSEPETKSFDLISEHIDSDFPLYIEPVSKNQLTENSKYYIVLASLERLAVLVGERHDPALEAGAITIEQVLKVLTDDLKNDSKAVLDGGNTINQFPVDSYLFRYWYAIAVKLFLESDENLTGLKFSDLQTVIHNISMDESELFPEADKAKKVTDKPPVISEKQFKRSFEAEFQDYSVSNIIYANDEVFSLEFRALPDDSGDLFLDTVELTGDVEIQSISDINEEGIYTAEVKFPVSEDGDKNILISAVDNAENTGTATLQAVRDTVNPVIANLGGTLPVNVTTPLTVPYSVTETNPFDTSYSFTAVGDPAGTWITLAPALITGDITITNSFLTDDGAYTLHFRTVDKAGNETVQTKTLTFDRIIPTATFTTIPEINENGFIAQDSIAITIIAEDNITPEVELIHEMWNGVKWSENPAEVKNVWNMQLLSNQLYETKYRVKDLAGNRSADINVSFTVDTVKPVLTTNKTVLESRAYRIDDENLELISTCTDTNILAYTYSINGGDPVTISMASIPLINNEALTEGNNTVTVNCTDKAGNLTEAVITLIIDNTPPVISILSGPSLDSSVCSINQNISVKGVDALSRPVKAKYSYSVNSLAESSIYEVTLNDSGEGTLTFPSSTDSFYLDPAKYENGINSAYLSVVIDDEAGNEPFPYLIRWTLDKRAPSASLFEINEYYFAVVNEAYPLFHSDSIDYANFDTWIAAKATDAGLNEIKKMRSYRNGTLSHTYTVLNETGSSMSEGECANYICGGENNYYAVCKICLHPEEFPEIFDFKVTFEDTCGNSGKTTDCKLSNYFCLSSSVNVAEPPLYVSANFSGKDNLRIELQAEGAIVESCNILKGGTNYAVCNPALPVQYINTATYPEGNYSVRAVSKFSGGSVTTTKEASFIIDRTPFAISVSLKNGQTWYLKESPVFQYSVQIATGVKSATFKFHDRTVNQRYPHSSYSCNSTTGLCVLNGYNKQIYSSSSSSGTFSVPIEGVLAVPGGIYTKIRYEIIPNFGDTVTGELSVTPVNLITKDSEDLALWYEGGQIKFRESIISRKLSTSHIKKVGFSHYADICKKSKGIYFYHKRNTLSEAGFSVTLNESGSNGTVSISKENSVYYWGRIDRSSAWADDGSCSTVSDCPSTAYECSDQILGDPKECVAARGGNHYSDSGSFAHYGHSCNCDDWSGNVNCLEYNCQYLRDMEYYPEGAYVAVYDYSDRGRITAYLKDLSISTKKQTDCF